MTAKQSWPYQSKHIKKYLAKLLFVLLFAFFLYEKAEANNFIKISDSNDLYYEDQGIGQPVIFVPGWTANHNFFLKQVDYFKKKYRVITLDPRGQGLSSKTLDHNNYTQHGNDLGNFIQDLNLKGIILVGWSWGCYDAYAYIRQYGTSNIKAFVCIDAAPKAYGPDNQWRAAVSHQDAESFIQAIEYKRDSFIKTWLQSMVDKPLLPSQLDYFSQESMRTPTYITLLLLFDALNSDYSYEAKLLDKNKVPVLNFISLSSKNKASDWQNKNTPHAKAIYMGKHLMFW